MYHKKNTSFDFFKSSFESDKAYKTIDEIIQWINLHKKAVNLKIKKTSFSDLELWSFNNYNLSHASGKFFSIDGIRVNTNWGGKSTWDQPIINQPEVGILGFIVKNINGTLHFLVQAKIEPGNINYVQISPTLQATKSNYTQVHKGKKPKYLDYFLKVKPEEKLLDQLQSEQGARFFKKRNRNLIIKVEGDIEVYENYTWLTLYQIKKLMAFDNLVNMDTRSVISGISYGSFKNSTIDFFKLLANEKEEIKSKFFISFTSKNRAYNSLNHISNTLTNIKSSYDLNVTKIPLKNLKNWNIGSHEIFHQDKKYFKIIAVNVEISGREVKNWSQPMIEPINEGLCAFICKEINGILHFIVQMKLECGNHDIIEYAPTVQTLTGDYKDPESQELPFLNYVINAKTEKIIYCSKQSEEGGRFYNEENKNLIILADDEIDIELPKNYIWMTLYQLTVFLRQNNYLNVQARNLISLLEVN